MKHEYTITAYSENNTGLLHRIVILFTKRKINIESFTASESEFEDIHRFTIVVNETEETVKKVTKQIEKQIEVLKAMYYRTDEVVQQEMALYKLPTDVLALTGKAEQIIREHNARILTIENDFTIIEKTGLKQDTENLFKALKPYGLKEFVRSGKVAVAREHHGIDALTAQF